ncbi:MAG: hypothetical protein JJ895_02110 [Balneolaceae bacterium]|nr:hypothetical protein [Balneolaceae bacterium]
MCNTTNQFFWLFLIGFLILCTPVDLKAQDFQPISKIRGNNYFLGLGIGDAQLNQYNNSGTFGRSTYFPRLSVEFGRYYKIDPLFGLLISAKISHQRLRLHPIQTEEEYNDLFSFTDLQLRYGVYLGKDLIKLHLGGSMRTPLWSRFKVKSLNGKGEEDWYDLSNEVKASKISFATELGLTFMFKSFHISPTFTWNLREFIDSSFSNGAYLFDDTEYYTLEFIIYIPLEL